MTGLLAMTSLHDLVQNWLFKEACLQLHSAHNHFRQACWWAIAGAEVLLIIACLYLTLKRLSRKEVITVDNEAIRLEWGYNHPQVTVNLPRHWIRLSYNCPDSAFEVGHLSVAAHGKRYALGRCLNKEEKKALYTELKAALNR